MTKKTREELFAARAVAEKVLASAEIAHAGMVVGDSAVAVHGQVELLKHLERLASLYDRHLVEGEGQ